MGESASLRYIQTKKHFISWKLSIVFMYMFVSHSYPWQKIRVWLAKKISIQSLSVFENHKETQARDSQSFPKEAPDLQIQT